MGPRRDDNLQLREFPTLNHVAAWVRSRLGVPAPAAGAALRSPLAPPIGTGARCAPRRLPLPLPRQRRPGTPILDTVTRIVAEMTGYPADLLDPDLDLEADLGVDTVKQAEVFAAVRARWNLERDDTLQLREFPTLNHVAGWVRGKLGAPEPAPRPHRAARRRPRRTRPPRRAATPTAATPADPILGDRHRRSSPR